MAISISPRPQLWPAPDLPQQTSHKPDGKKPIFVAQINSNQTSSKTQSYYRGEINAAVKNGALIPVRDYDKETGNGTFSAPLSNLVRQGINIPVTTIKIVNDPKRLFIEASNEKGQKISIEQKLLSKSYQVNTVYNIEGESKIKSELLDKPLTITSEINSAYPREQGASNRLDPYDAGGVDKYMYQFFVKYSNGTEVHLPMPDLR